jgi:RNA polymerase sigma-70 factor (ECF subfamily)
LGELDRHTLEAFYFRGQSLAEMSRAFAAPVGTIKRRLHVARKRLAAQLEAAAAV